MTTTKRLSEWIRAFHSDSIKVERWITLFMQYVTVIAEFNAKK